jgi:integrase
MARPKKSDVPDLSQVQDLTAGSIERLTCPEEKAQAFLRDAKAPGLRVRVTAAGAKSFVFEGKLNRQTIRRTIGDVRTWSIEAARTEARKLAVMLDSGIDPRELDRQQAEAKAARESEEKARALTVGEVWPQYLEQGRPKRKADWKPRYRADLEAMADPGGKPKKRGTGLTRPGPLFPLMELALADVNEDALKVWFDREAVAGPHQAARALMMFRGFLRWCTSRPEYRNLADRGAGQAPAILDAMPSATRRTDALESSQVSGWWVGVMQLPNPTASAYLRALLLTGARREEMAALKWDDIEWRWGKLTIADKVGDTRTIPLTPYLAQVLASLPRRTLTGDDGKERPNPYVFASASKAGRIVDARASHERALKSAGVEHLTLHGLRRSFALLGEAAGAPAGAIAQVMGHRPSATAEGYKPRSVEALKPYLTRIEAHVLALVGVEQPSASEVTGLRIVHQR